MSAYPEAAIPPKMTMAKTADGIQNSTYKAITGFEVRRLFILLVGADVSHRSSYDSRMAEMTSSVDLRKLAIGRTKVKFSVGGC